MVSRSRATSTAARPPRRGAPTHARAVVSVVVGGLLVAAAACSDASTPLAPDPAAPALAKGGGGTATPPPPAFRAMPVIVGNVGAQATVGQTLTWGVIATSETGNRRAPVLTAAGEPAGMAAVVFVPVDSPHGGGSGYTVVTYSWTPTADQAGLAPRVVLTATTAAGSTTTTAEFPPVLPAPR